MKQPAKPKTFCGRNWRRTSLIATSFLSNARISFEDNILTLVHDLFTPAKEAIKQAAFRFVWNADFPLFEKSNRPFTGFFGTNSHRAFNCADKDFSVTNL